MSLLRGGMVLIRVGRVMMGMEGMGMEGMGMMGMMKMMGEVGEMVIRVGMVRLLRREVCRATVIVIGGGAMRKISWVRAHRGNGWMAPGSPASPALLGAVQV